MLSTAAEAPSSPVASVQDDGEATPARVETPVDEPAAEDDVPEEKNVSPVVPIDIPQETTEETPSATPAPEVPSSPVVEEEPVVQASAEDEPNVEAEVTDDKPTEEGKQVLHG